jgi:acylphosphatase
VKRVHLIVSGVVQGVGFRHNTRRKARLGGLTGYVRNLPDSSVEIEAQGTTEELDRFIHWTHHGPANAVVESVIQKEMTVIQDEREFEVR